jgi:precorrin isomerase
LTRTAVIGWPVGFVSFASRPDAAETVSVPPVMV